MAPNATDTLANERTYLAYVRTALAFIAFGFVVARFALFERELAIVRHGPLGDSGISIAFGALMALAGVACGAYGRYRYVRTAKSLRAGAVSPMPENAAVAGSVAIGVIGLAVTWAIFATR
jgi:putative membrane protein